jgi:hypothetical protein
MRQTAIAATIALVTTIVSIWGATVITANRKAVAASASLSIDVMRMMQGAKNLPDQQFDAH